MKSTLRTLLENIREATQQTSEADKGHRFEVLIKRYFETDPVYRSRFSGVWLWSEWPYSEGHDVGIDLVAKEADSDRYVAIQCKFYESDHLMSLPDVQTFFAALNATIKTEHSKKDSFAGGIIVGTTDHWNVVLLNTMHRQHLPCQRIGLSDLEEAAVDWFAISKGQAGEITKYDARPHQREAIDAVISGFNAAERGKLIMACGTGKTFTALRLTEEYTNGKGCVLFLAPSIALVAQSLREWMAQTTCKIHPIAVCSDGSASSIDDLNDLSARDLPARATTDPATIAQLYGKFKDSHLTVIFSTYQSIEKLHKAQKKGALPEFDLCICDEAHRTTGVSLLDAKTGKHNESHFVKVHQQDYIACRKRLYMTATPKIYSEEARRKARDANAELASMDKIELYGEEFFRLPFSRAVREGLLADYKVLVLCVDEDYVKDIMGEHLQQDATGAIELDDAVRLVGCYNGLRKKMMLPSKPAANGEDGEAYDPSLPDLLAYDEDFLTSDPAPMKRAVSFANVIKTSKKYTEMWGQVVDAIRKNEEDDSAFLDSEMQHVDGNMDMGERAALLSWLKGNAGTNATQGVAECRVLSNARCLSEGVDVPSLDAVMFLSPRKSQVDVVQSVGRVMRTAKGKKFGYIILPIGISPKDKPEEVLDKDEKYRVVWDVLQALRSHDDRFNAEINSIELNKGRGKRIVVGGVTGKKGKKRNLKKKDAYDEYEEDVLVAKEGDDQQLSFDFDFEKELPVWTDGILVRTVQKCGDRRYWEDWAKNIAKIAESQISAINDLLDKGIGLEEFQLFLSGLRENTNPAITEADAIEMLAQQFISRPVFNALFEKYQFAENNPVSKTMNAMLDIVRDNTNAVDLRELDRFYHSVKDRAQSIDNAAGRQQVVVELYDKFFKQAFPKMSEKLGIVYTPIPVVDFIVHSVHEVLKKEFGVKDGIGAQGVKILDPFTGTGTFIVRAIQSGLIRRSQLPYKYRNELFACEIVLLAYYIACVNIEVAYHGVMKQEEYEPFNGICLTDTFRMDGNSANDKDLFAAFEDNGERVKNLCKQDIRVIIGNPPYSVGQKSANDNNQNEAYPYLDERIAETYAKTSKATNKNSLYDAYIRAFRWASDRITDDGILAFVTNGAYIDNNAMSGFRQSLMGEYDAIYCFNLRGNQRTSGEQSRKEGGKIFGSGSRTPIAIIILVKKKNRPAGQQATLHYHDIGDYLSREQKLEIIQGFGNYSAIPWQTLIPDEHGDWLNHRTSGYEKFLPIGDKTSKGKPDTKTAFTIFCRGLGTSRDTWAYSFSKARVLQNMKNSIEFYNSQVAEYHSLQGTRPSVEDFINTDASKISWSRAYRQTLQKGVTQTYSEHHAALASYRPYVKQNLYFDRRVLNDVGPLQSFFPSAQHKNLVISMLGVGASKDFSCIITNVIPDVQLMFNGQCYPLYWYEERNADAPMLDLGMEANVGDYKRHDGISNFGLKQFRAAYGAPKIGKEDIFYYVYGRLHSTEYRTRFENDLKKELPRIPFAKDFWTFSKAGRKLAELHLNYETIEPWPVKEESHGNFRVTKMRFPKKGIRHTILYNDSCTLSEIPEEAYEYIVNGKSAIEWLIERYAVTTDKDSCIVNDPNDWCDEQGNPRYIIDLVKRVIRVSIETMEIVKFLPPLEEM